VPLGVSLRSMAFSLVGRRSLDDGVSGACAAERGFVGV